MLVSILSNYRAQLFFECVPSSLLVATRHVSLDSAGLCGRKTEQKVIVTLDAATCNDSIRPYGWRIGRDIKDKHAENRYIQFRGGVIDTSSAIFCHDF